MSDFGEVHGSISCKIHRCEACWHTIAAGEIHQQVSVVSDGKWQHHRMHDECFVALEEDGGEEFCPGELPPPARLVKTGGAA